MVTTEQVKGALAALVDREDDPGPASTVAAAEWALRDLDRAAAWVADGGERRLARAAVRAEVAGEERLRRRAETIQRALHEYRVVASTPPGAEAPTPPPGDHFHSGRTTLLGADGVRRDR